jgi:NAD-dependent SIR2 family protein deacetylase
VIFVNRFVQRLDKAKEVIDNADYIIIGAGAGLSTAAGIDYGFDRFSKYFQDFIDKYHFEDLYTSGFYPFETQEEKWAYWARHIQVNRYDVGKTVLYQKLLNLVKDKDYFVLTTNVEHQFWINEFEDERIFATQGDYGLLQCSKACHDKLYDNEKQVSEWIEKTVDCKIPSDLVPKCPVCGADMETNLRKDNLFVEDEKWHEMKKNYAEFLGKIDEDENKAYIISNVFRKTLTDNGFDERAITSWLRSNNLIEPDKNGKNTKYTSVDGHRARYIIMDLPINDEVEVSEHVELL